MRSALFLCIVASSLAGTLAQYPGGSPPWGQGGGQGPNRPSYGKPSRPSAYGGGGSSSPYGKPGSSSSGSQYDDPIPPNPSFDSSYDPQQLPSKLPILAPNGVVEIYNRVVDDLIKRLDADFKKKEIDPMAVVIRPTPAGPVRVPGHLQKRPFRRPGAALYRASLGGPPGPVRTKKARALEGEDVPVAEGAAEEKPSFRGAGKISKGPLGEEKDTPETTPVSVPGVAAGEIIPVPSVPETPATVAVPAAPVSNRPDEVSSEENFFRARSDEYFSDDDIEVDAEDNDKEEVKEVSSSSSSRDNNKKESKSKAKKEETDEDEEEDLKDKAEGKKDVETLLQRYQNKNVHEPASTTKGKAKYSAAGAKKKEEPAKQKPKPDLTEDDDELLDGDNDNDDDEDEEIHDDFEQLEPGTIQSAGNRPSGGYYPPGGPPAIPTKPNARLTGLSKIRRASDVAVSVDARSAVITARLLVGPLNVIISDSTEPMEKNVRATIPELEAELILMERHGVVFLQRFTLDRAYGQDVEISIPKTKAEKNKNKGTKNGMGGPGFNPSDPNHSMHPGAQQRYQTKMAAHISMEVVKLLRSGNLRVNIMRTAQSSMSKLKLPIKSKTSKKKNKKAEKNDN